MQNTESWLEAVASTLKERSDLIVEAQLTRMRQESPAFFQSDDPDYVAAYEASCRAHCDTVFTGMRTGRDIPLALPAAAVEETRAVAEWGIALDALAQTYRTGHAVIWEQAMDVVELIVPNEARGAVLRLVSRYLFSYTDQMVNLISDLYERERLTLFHDRDRQKRQAIRDLLDGLPVDPSRLPYVLSGLHIAAVASGDALQRSAGAIADRLEATYLAVTGPSQSTWAFFGGKRLADPMVQDALRASMPVDIAIGLGNPGEGIDGLRMSHIEARQAYRVARRTKGAVVSYRDVALLSLVTMDEGLARQFMVRELGFLVGDEPRIEELRETLANYFATGHNASTTAARLKLNDRTVAYRLRSIEERLGRSILKSRDELSVALQLHAYFAVRVDD